MTWVRTNSRFMYSQNTPHMNRIPYSFPRSGYSTCRVAVARVVAHRRLSIRAAGLTRGYIYVYIYIHIYIHTHTPHTRTHARATPGRRRRRWRVNPRWRGWRRTGGFPSTSLPLSGLSTSVGGLDEAKDVGQGMCNRIWRAAEGGRRNSIFNIILHLPLSTSPVTCRLGLTRHFRRWP